MSRIRVLLLAEAVTLAHVARPVALAAGLDRRRFDVHFASAPQFDSVIGDLPYTRHELASIGPTRFLDALARGAPLYTEKDLHGYTAEECRLFADIAPDIVVGDFRLSLAVSARLARIPYAAIANAYWSVDSGRRIPLPELPLTRALGVRAAAPIFAAARPFAFALHTLAHNRLRRYHGLPTLGSDLRAVYTDADHLLFADPPELAPAHVLSRRARFLGPVLWSPSGAPGWWNDLPEDRPLVYVTLGSSGASALLRDVVRALAEVPVTVLTASAGAGLPDPLPANVFVSEYLPGDAAARRSALVICNGGSPTVQQALAAGRPVLGLPANMDQHLSMWSVVAAGAGTLLRSEHASPAAVAAATRELLADTGTHARAKALAHRFATYDAPATFADAVAEIIRGGPAQPALTPG
ncbi:glycosyltransferase [Nocardia sp. NPDC127579]|uniref:glycosyltransferase n=1 Tax=Nocardia sp. NPDC127579 TaxID=3345402 RepID=UPI003644EA2D